MYVTKRDGSREPVSFDQILSRIRKLSDGLEHVNPDLVAQKVCSQLSDGIETSKLDEFAAETCAMMQSRYHPNYGLLAARILVDNHQKNTPATLLECAETLYHDQEIVSERYHDLVCKHSAEYQAMIDYSRDFVFDYFGFKTLERSYLLRKDDVKSEKWIQAYEDRNVLIGLAAGFSGKAQIGKGMWARPDDMAAMLAAKAGHPNAGANTAWVPSPTAATLHALHYHQIDVFEAQKRRHNQPTPGLGELFSMPVLDASRLDRAAVTAELENNAQGILGYVVRWVDEGVGCSKVPDIHNVGLMEDRATCRISSQAIANWLLHGLISKDDVTAVFERMAAVVDGQNAGDPNYIPMSGNFGSIAFQAALDLALKGADQPSGYTEPLLHAARERVKLEGEKRP